MNSNNLSIEKIIDEYIAKKREETKRDYSHWFMSSLGGCLSGVYYSRLYNGSEFTPQKLRVFEIGNLFEELIAKIVKKRADNDFKVFTQEKVENKELDVSGRIDILVRQAIRDIIYELKTIHERGFFYNDLPYPHHIMQITAYKHFLFGNTDRAETRLVYISKDSFLVKEFLIPYQPLVVKDIINQLTILNKAWKEKKPPKPEPNIVFDNIKKKWVVNWKARYCPYHHLCTGNDHWLEEAKLKVAELNKK